MGQFSKLYENLAKDYLSEQEQTNINTSDEVPPDVDVGDTSDTTQDMDLDQPSALENIEEDSIKVDWIKKIIRLLTLLNRSDDNVERILSDITSGSVNADTLKTKEDQIEELLRTIPTEKSV
jgi:hypothetical protein